LRLAEIIKFLTENDKTRLLCSWFVARCGYRVWGLAFDQSDRPVKKAGRVI
jgi:hypothetical protein